MPDSHAHDSYRIEIVCLGNICRSPMAHVVLDDRLSRAGLADRVHVSSSGTGGWHTGDPMDPRAADVLAKNGYDPSRHRARKFTVDAYAENELLLAMDHSNRADMIDQAPTPDETRKVDMFRAFDPRSGPHDDEVPDPWYGGPEGFDQVLETIERTCDALTERLPALLNA